MIERLLFSTTHRKPGRRVRRESHIQESVSSQEPATSDAIRHSGLGARDAMTNDASRWRQNSHKNTVSSISFSPQHQESPLEQAEIAAHSSSEVGGRLACPRASCQSHVGSGRRSGLAIEAHDVELISRANRCTEIHRKTLAWLRHPKRQLIRRYGIRHGRRFALVRARPCESDGSYRDAAPKPSLEPRTRKDQRTATYGFDLTLPTQQLRRTR
jgi:hypothetical protein